MTTKEIAELCGVDESTVLRWAKKAAVKYPSIQKKLEASGHGTPALFALEEVIESVKEGRGQTYADLLKEAASKMQAAAGKMQAAKRMSGAYLAEINKSFDRQILTKDEARALIGLGPEKKQEPIMISGNIGKISKQAYAVEMKVREKEQAKKDARNMKSLFDEEAGK